MLEFCSWIIQFTPIIQNTQIPKSLNNCFIDLFLPCIIWHLVNVFIHLTVSWHFNKGATYALTFIQIRKAWLGRFELLLIVGYGIVKQTGNFLKRLIVSGFVKLYLELFCIVKENLLIFDAWPFNYLIQVFNSLSSYMLIFLPKLVIYLLHLKSMCFYWMK